jgi:hypothetical protein
LDQAGQLAACRSRGRQHPCRAGEITLNVSLDARFRRVSAALLGALERRAVERGSKLRTLKSTETARRFYLARGYSEAGPVDGKSAQRLATR